MKSFQVAIVLVSLLPLFMDCQNRKKPLFEKVAPEDSHIYFSNVLTPSDTFNAFTFTNYYNGGGVAVGDVNNDGYPDVFFSANQTSCQLYLNTGKGFTFEDITVPAGLVTDTWCTGASMVDINQDGWLDIYVGVAAHPTLRSTRNLLYINQGVQDGQVKFKEAAAAYGLDYAGFTTQAAFLDYDLDGDLDVFLLNTAPDVQNPNNLRPAINDGTYPSTDRLLRNEGRNPQGQITFENVSAEAGILYEGLGLGVVVSDLNHDGYPDIYCSNDFISSDILYLNNGDGTFRNCTRQAMAHTSLYGMGVDAADMNNDGKVDLLQLDMLPGDNFRQKQMMAGQDFDRKEMSISSRYGYQLQYMRNTFQLNIGNTGSTGEPIFSEIGLLAGVARTDWSWASLLADFDNDSRRDVFISNGYRKNITDRDFLSYTEEFGFFGTDQTNQRKRDELLEKVPEVKLRNYAYRQTSDLQFEDMSAHWGLDEPTFSNGAAWADFDQDGDLDLVVNNIDSEALLYRNNLAQDSTHNYLRIQFDGPAMNRQGLGARVTLWSGSQSQTAEHYQVRGYASSVEPGLHFGMGPATTIDSLLIEWPGNKIEKRYRLTSNQTIRVSYQQAVPYSSPNFTPTPLFTSLDGAQLFNYQHRESDFVDFKQTATLHKMLSRNGFPIAVGDVNGDQKEDVFVGGTYRGSHSYLYIQEQDAVFRPVLLSDSLLSQTTNATFVDADQDGDLDLMVVFGGSERPLSVTSAYQPRLYLNNGRGVFTESATGSLPSMAVSASCIVPLDYDQDGDMDLFIGGRQTPGRYPFPPRSYLLRNDSRQGYIRYTDVTAQQSQELLEPGMVCDARSADLNNDTWPDLILVGEWMPIRMFVNQGGRGFTPYAADQLGQTQGWWNCVATADVDQDGDMDFIVGNEGLNTFYSASFEKPIRMVAKDFNNDGTIDPIMGYYLGDDIYPAHPRDALNQQIIQFRRKFPKYADYARATFRDLFSKEELQGAYQAQATTLASTLILNEGGGRFYLQALPTLAQLAPVFGIVPHDIDQDGHLDLVLSGNFYPNEVHLGRQDASYGLVLVGNGKGGFKPLLPTESGLMIRGDARGSQMLSIHKGHYLLTSVNSSGITVHQVHAPRRSGPPLAASAHRVSR